MPCSLLANGGGHKTSSLTKQTSRSGEWWMVVFPSGYPHPLKHSLFLSFCGWIFHFSLDPIISLMFLQYIFFFFCLHQMVVGSDAYIQRTKTDTNFQSFFDASHIVDPSLLLSFLNLMYVSSKVHITILVQSTWIAIMYLHSYLFHWNMKFLRKRTTFYSFLYFNLPVL